MLVAEPDGESAAPKVALQRGVNNPSLAPAALGVPVARETHHVAGLVGTAPPRSQSSMIFSP